MTAQESIFDSLEAIKTPDSFPSHFIIHSTHTHICLCPAREVAMPILKQLRSYLDTNKIPYEVASHPRLIPPTTWRRHSMCQAKSSPKS
ncbi:MAG: hypothetical protein EWM72_02050 [Nitrospira sp.]|nr:MAG: hypothetical protein EWM72_02050 [Nitrospira sp.]